MTLNKEIMHSVFGRGRQRESIMDIYKMINHADRLKLDLSFIYQNTENWLYYQMNKRKHYFRQ